MNDKTILLVEDSSDDEALTLRALKKNNICNEVIVAHDGAEALDYLRGKGNGLPDLVLLDLKLPKANALEVLRHVRTEARTRLLPVVILTTSRKKQDVINGYHLGANSYIRKPADFGQFTEAVHKLGLYWLMLNESPSSPQRLT
jgi:two-component system response regulator